VPDRPVPAYSLTYHSRTALSARGISLVAVESALRWGRRFRSHSAWVFRLDRRSVAAARALGVRVHDHEGVAVVLSESLCLITAWRNRSPRRVWR
jgi:hypothetical protein